MAGIIRALDKQRRLIIPKELLASANIDAGDLVEVWVGQTEDNKPCVILEKVESATGGCPFCGAAMKGGE